MIRVADYVMQRLYLEGIKHIFLVTGRGVLYLTDAVAKQEGMNGISMYHEQSASFAAMSYAQCNETLGACLVSTGCAATNAITGLLCAWQDNVPCIFISGQNILNETTRYTGVPIRTYGSQEADIVGVVQSISKYAVMISDPRKIVYEMDKAIFLAQSGRKGPVWIDIPVDVQNMRIEPEELEKYVLNGSPSYEPSKSDLNYVKEALCKAKRPTILLGSGLRSAGAVEIFNTFIEKNLIPVTFSSSAVDAYGADNEISIGAVGSMAGSREGNFAVQNADLVLVIGCRLPSILIGPDFNKFARMAKIIVVDIDANEHSKKNIEIDRLIISDAKLFLEQLLQQKICLDCSEWIRKCLHWKSIFGVDKKKFQLDGRIDLYYFSKCLAEMLPEDAIVVTDAGLEELIIPSTVHFQEKQRCIHSFSQGAMGYALPAAIGAYYATQKNVVAIIGDGSIMMNLQELQTVSYAKLPIKIIVINNNMYAVIRKRQRELFRNRTIGNDSSDGVGSPDFKKIAECFDIPYMKIENGFNLEAKLNEVLSLDSSVICEVLSLEDQKYLHASYTLNKQRKLVRRPIEDMSPFIDRDLFVSEMIIEPIDQ